MLRWIATFGIGMLLALDLALPGTMLGRRGTDPTPRSEVQSARLAIGDTLPPLQLVDLEGRQVDLSDFIGHRVLITFERSVDW